MDVTDLIKHSSEQLAQLAPSPARGDRFSEGLTEQDDHRLVAGSCRYFVGV